MQCIQMPYIQMHLHMYVHTYIQMYVTVFTDWLNVVIYLTILKIHTYVFKIIQ